MNKASKITINGKQYPIKFGYGATRLLGKYWGLPGFMDVVNTVSGIVPKTEDGDPQLLFENLDKMADVVFAGISNASKQEVDIDTDDIIDALFEDMEQLALVFQLFAESMPKAQETPQPKKSTGKGKPRTAAK